MSITTSPEIKNISAALLGFQGQVRGVGRDSTNPGFKSKYASLENVVDTIREALQSSGLAFMQSGGAIVDGTMAMTTRIIHASSGEWIEGNMDIMLGKRDPQGVGSAQTYAQRYHLMAMLGLPPVDDDGEAAIDRKNERPAQIYQKVGPNPNEAPREPVEDLPVPKVGGLKNTAQRAVWGRLVAATRKVKSIEEFNQLWDHPASKAAYDNFSPDWQQELDAEKRDKAAELQGNDPFANLAPNDIDVPHATRVAQTP